VAIAGHKPQNLVESPQQLMFDVVQDLHLGQEYYDLEALEGRRRLSEDVVGQFDVADTSRDRDGPDQRAEHQAGPTSGMITAAARTSDGCVSR
jgi:hypothetical protein